MQAVSDNEVIDEELLQIFAPYFSRQDFKAHDLLYAANSEAVGFYIVELGQLGLAITNNDVDQKSIVVETLLPGTMVGELEVFASRPRICNLICLSDATVWFLSKHSYETLSKSHPDLMLKVFCQRISV
jgi:SulP family sulfate permease